ncbi:DUF4136 domain-containing protein [Pollutimonas thiosulfatoxidans]|nr:DUF4136 domain-containing protein [Pollutimonas thiosulfatoxidans]
MKKLILLVLLATLTGCAALSRPEVTVNAIAAPDADQYKTYVMMPADEKSRGLEFDQYVALVDQALAEKGFIKVNEISQANIAIGLTTNVGDAKATTNSGVIPQWGQTGYRSAQTYGSVVGNQYQANTYYTPTYGVTGYMPYSNTVTYYPIGFALGAWAKTADGKDIRQVWNIVASGNSRNGDLRSAFPKMLRAAMPYIAGDSKGMIKITVPNN